MCRCHPIRLALAGVRTEIYPVYREQMEKRLAGYGDGPLPENAPVITVRTSPEEIEAEKERTIQCWIRTGMEIPEAGGDYFEMTAVLRRVLEEILQYGVLYIHGSAICMDGRGYLFTAPSGTGKSTHARLWKERFGDRVTVINDDKPLVRVSEDGIFLCGSPWNGKHGIGCQMEAPLRAVVRLRRGEKNEIRPISTTEALKELYLQTLRFRDAEKMQMVLQLLGAILENVPCYGLTCTMDPDAAETARRGLEKDG